MAEMPVIEALRAKIEWIIAENRRVRAESEKILRQDEKLREENRKQAARIAELEKRVMTLELGGGMAGKSDDKKAARARVNRLMREVDKCIALLNRE